MYCTTLMFRLRCGTAGALIAAAALCHAAVAIQWQDLTPEDAQVVVIAFQGGGPLEFGSVELTQWAIEQPPHYHEVSQTYELAPADDSRAYWVSRWWEHGLGFFDRSYSAAWVGGEEPGAWEDFYGQAYSQAELLAAQMSLEDAQQIAEMYAQSHYPDFALLNRMGSGTRNDTLWGFSPAYAFLFYSETNDGTYALNQCFVLVDSVLGKIVKYWHTYFPIEVSTIPIVTADEAAAIALTALMEPGSVVLSVKGPSVVAPDALGVQRLVWEPTLEGYESVTGEYRWENYLAYVDAHTGELIYYGRLLGVPATGTDASAHPQANTLARVAKDSQGAGSREESLSVNIGGEIARLTYAPLLRYTHPYLYVRYLCAFGAKSFGYEAGAVYVRTDQGLAVIRVGKRAIILGGKVVNYDAAPINVRGRVYLPLSMFRDLAGADITYDPAAKRLQISGVRRAGFQILRAASPQ